MRRSILSVVALAALAAGCGGRPAVASISLRPNSSGALPSVGDTVQLSATALDGTGAPIPGVSIAFSSSAVDVASVTSSGLVTAVANGTATIQVSAEEQKATQDITVSQVVAQLVVTPASIRVPPGETPLFHAEALDARGNVVTRIPFLRWNTTHTIIATIASNGRARVAPAAPPGGTSRAVATIGSVSSAADGLMTVDRAAVYVEQIVITAPVTTLIGVNHTVQVAASASNQRQGDVTSIVTFTWASSAPGVATVSPSGLVTAVGDGTTSISATSNGVSGLLTVIVAGAGAGSSNLSADGAPAR